MPAEPPGFFLATRNAINSSKKFIYQLANTLHKQQKANGQWALIKDPLQIETLANQSYPQGKAGTLLSQTVQDWLS